MTSKGPFQSKAFYGSMILQELRYSDNDNCLVSMQFMKKETKY